MPKTYGPYISKVTLPSGNTYDIKDEEARELIMEITSPGVFLGITTSNISEGSTTNPIVVDGSNVTAHNGDWCLHQETVEGVTSDIAYIFNSNNKWQKFTDMSNLGGLAYKNSASGTVNDYVTGVSSASTTVNSKTLKFTPAGSNAASSVSFAAHTTATVLKSDVTATVPKTSSTTKYLTKDTALTGLGTASTDTFVKSYPGATSKMNTTTVTGVSGSTTASKATAGTAVNVATTDTPVNCANGVLDNANGQSANTVMWGASVSDETLSFSFKTLHTNPVTPAKSNGTITPYTFADVTVPKAASTATTVATGALSANGGGASVMTGLGTATTAAAVTGYASPTTKKFVDGTTTTSGTDTITYVESVGTSGTDAVTFVTTGHTAAAITALGAATAAAQTFTGTEADLSHDHTTSTTVTLTKGNKTITVS